jgi:hypothetical protein
MQARKRGKFFEARNGEEKWRSIRIRMSQPMFSHLPG